MAKLGFSLYPEHYSLETIQAYIQQFQPYHCQKVFLSLLQLDPSDKDLLDHYAKVVQYCQQVGLDVFADMSPQLIAQLGWQDSLIEAVHRFGLKGLRLDESYEADELVELTQNSLGIKIEINMSTESSLLETIIEKGANLANLTACHNFYPHAFTGLGIDYFLKMSALYKKHGIETAAFIHAKTADTGPWPLSEGLCTLEHHRNQPLNTQYKWLSATGLIDHILIANQLVSPEELATIQQDDDIVFEIEVTEDISAVERSILSEQHRYRGDHSDYLVRSTDHRSRYNQATISPIEQDKQVKRGHILIDNQLYTRYCGELQIALKDFRITEKTNQLATICDDDLPLLDLLKPWQAFRFHIRTK
ncbi:DUF871 domain-containing protein [Streptococcus cameli]